MSDESGSETTEDQPARVTADTADHERDGDSRPACFPTRPDPKQERPDEHKQEQPDEQLVDRLRRMAGSLLSTARDAERDVDDDRESSETDRDVGTTDDPPAWVYLDPDCEAARRGAENRTERR